MAAQILLTGRTALPSQANGVALQTAVKTPWEWATSAERYEDNACLGCKPGFRSEQPLNAVSAMRSLLSLSSRCFVQLCQAALMHCYLTHAQHDLQKEVQVCCGRLGA